MIGKLMFAIEIKWEPGVYLYVVGDDEKPILYESRADAERAATIWKPGVTKVTEYPTP